MRNSNLPFIAFVFVSISFALNGCNSHTPSRQSLVTYDTNGRSNVNLSSDITSPDSWTLEEIQTHVPEIVAESPIYRMSVSERKDADEVLDELVGCQSVVLDISYSNATSKSLRSHLHSTQLKALLASGMPPDRIEPILNECKSSRSIRILCLDKTKLTSDDVMAISSIANIEYLSMASAGLTDDDILSITDMKVLHTLSVAGNNLSDNCIATLLDIPGLKFVDLRKNRGITDAGVKRLARHNNLRCIYVDPPEIPHDIDPYNNSLSKAAIDRINKAGESPQVIVSSGSIAKMSPNL